MQKQDCSPEYNVMLLQATDKFKFVLVIWTYLQTCCFTITKLF